MWEVVALVLALEDLPLETFDGRGTERRSRFARMWYDGVVIAVARLS
jgi:hypothetical protein